jgi:tRNA pseudouridine38-40 synthase
VITNLRTNSESAIREKNIFLKVEYDGTHFAGWQRQKSDPTIQGTIEAALGRMTRQEITLNGSGRTDAGVHAWGQTANFRCRTRLLPQDFIKGLNSMLPGTIAIRECREIPLEFHARFDAIGKTYLYRIYNHPRPRAIGRRYVWQIRKALDLSAMQGAADRIVGTHDFKAFEGSGSPRPHTRRSVLKAQFKGEAQEVIRFEIAADGFLRYMVRNLVGSLVDVGLGKIDCDGFAQILAGRDRLKAGITAPPQGLFLKEVAYDPASFAL